MKRYMTILVVLIALAWATGVRASNALKPTPPPTKAPAKPTAPPAQPTEAPAKPTSLPTQPPTKVPAKPTLPPTQPPTKPTVKPTVPPTAMGSPDKPTALPTPGSGPTEDVPDLPPAVTAEKATPLPTPTPFSGSGTSPTGQTREVTGRVFDDRDGDGLPDSNEAGVAGVSVIVNGEVVASTGDDGRFRFSLEGGVDSAHLSIIASGEWKPLDAPVEIAVPADVAIPLHRATEKKTPIKPETAATVTGGLLGAALLGALVFNALSSLAQAAAVRSLQSTYRRHKSQELELTMTQQLDHHRANLRDRLDADPDAWRGIVQQLLADAHVNTANLLAFALEAFTDPPRFVIDNGDVRYVFTTDPGRDQRLGGDWFSKKRVVALDAALSPTARVEAQAVWDHFMGSDTSMLPRDADWYLVVREAPKWESRIRESQWKRIVGYGAIALLALALIGGGVFLALSAREQRGIALPISTSTVTGTPAVVATTNTPTLVPTVTPTNAISITRTPTATATVFAPPTAVVTGTGGSPLRVRAQPAGEEIGQLPEGTEVTVLKGPVIESDIEWRLVEAEDVKGWVATEYLDVTYN